MFLTVVQGFSFNCLKQNSRFPVPELFQELVAISVNGYHTKNLPFSQEPSLSFKCPELRVCFHDGRDYVSYGLSQPDSVKLNSSE